MFSDQWKFIIFILSLNIFLSLVHFCLEKIKDKTESDIDNRLFDLIVSLENILRWITCNRK